MQRLCTLLFIAAIVFSTKLLGAIFETPHFADLKKYVSPDSLIILDIDDTLLLPVQTLGNDNWFLYRIEQNKKNGMPHSDAFERALAEWEAVRNLTHVKVVEPGAEHIVAALQEKGITMIGLTTQGLSLATRTVQQLQSLDIDISVTAPSKDDLYFMNGQGVLYRRGILFTSGTHKGQALLKLLDKLDFHPRRIVFITDKATHLRQVENSLKDYDIEFVGLRYSYSDERMANFRPELVDIQWHYSTLSHLLSDEEAERLLNIPGT